MATATIKQAFPLRTPYSDYFMEGRTAYAEAPGQTFNAGDPIYFDSNGQIALATDSGNNIPALGIIGFAKEDASGVENTPVPFVKPLNGELWVMNFDPPSGSEVTAVALRGTFVNFEVNASGYLTANNVSVDVAKPGGVILEIYTQAMGYLDATDALGDTNGQVVVELRTAAFQ